MDKAHCHEITNWLTFLWKTYKHREEDRSNIISQLCFYTQKCKNSAIKSEMFARFYFFFFFSTFNLKTAITVSLNWSPPTKLIITNYKNAPSYAKNAAIKFSYKPQRYKDSPVPLLKVYSQTCCHRPQHNWVDAEWKSPLSNYLTMRGGRVERHVWANLSTSVKYAGRSGWQIRGERLTDRLSHWHKQTWSSDEYMEGGTVLVG